MSPGCLCWHLWCAYVVNPNLALWRERRAVTSIEYAIIASIMAFSILLGATLIGQSLKATFNSVAAVF